MPEQNGASLKGNKPGRLHKRFIVKCKTLLHPNSRKATNEEMIVPQSDHLHGEDLKAVIGSEKLGYGQNVQQNDEYDDNDDDDSIPARCDFKTIAAIPDSKFQDLVRAGCDLDGTLEMPCVTGRTNGTYNYVAFVDVTGSDGVIQYVVRIPGHSTLTHWQPEDAYILKREVDLLKIIREQTSAPVPEIISYGTDHDNVLGYPFILMTKLPGKKACDIWFDQPYGQDNHNWANKSADVPTIGTERKRITFLRSLARIMTDIQSISFEQIGMPVYNEYHGDHYVGPTYHWVNDRDDKLFERAASDPTQGYIRTILEANFMPQWGPDVDFFSRKYGVYQILKMVFQQSVFNPPSPETFSIHHNDLDLQNILVDKDGNITGIIDWDNTFLAPRCIGAAAVPIFLRNDWFPHYANDLRIAPHTAWNYQYYREIYAAAMIEAGNDTDVKYTLKSAIYQAAIAAITEGGDATDLIEKLLREIPHCRVDVNDFKRAYGMGWPAARVYYF